jgi:hypothetical protein
VKTHGITPNQLLPGRGTESDLAVIMVCPVFRLKKSWTLDQGRPDTAPLQPPMLCSGIYPCQGRAPALERGKPHMSSLIMDGHLGPQTLRSLRPVEHRRGVTAPVAVRPVRFGHANCAESHRRCWRIASCGTAAGADLCGTVGRRARRSIGQRTRQRANACKQHAPEIWLFVHTASQVLVLD